jgi:predicted dienelactone hydrolase
VRTEQLRLSQFLDKKKIEIAGHSYGALSAMSLAGRLGSEQFTDKAISAAVLLLPGVGSIRNAPSVSRIRIPCLCITGGLDNWVNVGVGDKTVKAGVPLRNRMAVYEYLPPQMRQLLFLNKGDHMTFAGDKTVSPYFSRQPQAIESEVKNHLQIQSAIENFLSGLV